MTRPTAPRKWQAPPSRRHATAAELAAAILGAALDQASANAHGALASRDPEYIHQLRVGLRRYRSALRLFRGVMRGRAGKRLERRAAEIMGPLGATRDWDVCIAWLKGSRAQPSVLRRAQLIREALRKSLTPPDLARLRPAQDAWKKKHEALGDFRERALGKARRKVSTRLERLDWTDARRRHRLRIAVKRLRYAADFLGAETHSLQRLQESLGRLNDLAVIRRLLPELGAPAGLERKIDAAERRLLALARRQVASLELED